MTHIYRQTEIEVCGARIHHHYHHPSHHGDDHPHIGPHPHDGYLWGTYGDEHRFKHRHHHHL